MEELIDYKPLELGNGVDLQGQTLLLYKDGELLAEAEMQTVASSLEALLKNYRVPNIFPDYSFAYGGQLAQREIEISVDFPLPTSVGGHLRSHDEDGYWTAERAGANLFLLAENLPIGVRAYAGSEERGFGWRFLMPGFVREISDPVVRKRIAILSEGLVYKLAAGQIDSSMRKTLVDNLFSAQRPMWAEPLPWVVGDTPRAE